MAKFEIQFLSIVFIGKLNPQILNHDFLMQNHVLPENQEPFISLFAQKNKSPFSEFISTPVLANIKYDSISMLIDDNRFQAKHDFPENIIRSPIILITKKYFGELLRHTPLTIGGININCKIIFDSAEEEKAFDQKIGISHNQLLVLSNNQKIRVNLGFNYSWSEGKVEVNWLKPKDQDNQCFMNFNYEYPFINLDQFLNNLDKIDLVYEHFNKMISTLLRK